MKNTETMTTTGHSLRLYGQSGLAKEIITQPRKKRPRKPPPPERREEKRLSNIRRAKNEIESIALCNEWDWFVTLTIDKSHRDRGNLEEIHRTLSAWLRKQRSRVGELEFLLVPELHKDGKGWHLHGLIKGLPREALTQYKPAKGLPKYIRDAAKEGRELYHWEAYDNAYGYNVFEPLRSSIAAGRYMVKYAGKGLEETQVEVGKHLYWCSRGLKRPDLLTDLEADLNDILAGGEVQSSYEWEYGRAIWWQIDALLPRKE